MPFFPYEKAQRGEVAARSGATVFLTYLVLFLCACGRGFVSHGIVYLTSAAVIYAPEDFVKYMYVFVPLLVLEQRWMLPLLLRSFIVKSVLPQICFGGGVAPSPYRVRGQLVLSETVTWL